MGVERQSDGGQSNRVWERSPVEIGVKIRRPGETWFTSRVTDMSVSGFRLQSFMKLLAGSDIWIMLPGFDGRRARVSWVQGHEAGCAFENPLHPAILDHVIRMGAVQRP